MWVRNGLICLFKKIKKDVKDGTFFIFLFVIFIFKKEEDCFVYK